MATTIIIRSPDHPAAPLEVPSDLLPPDLLDELRRRGYIHEREEPKPSKPPKAKI